MDKKIINVIENIKEVEKRAEKKVRQEQDECEKIIKGAQAGSAKIIEREIELAENEATQFRLAVEEEGKKRAASIKVEAEREKVRILQKAREKSAKALQYVTDKVTHGYQ